MIRMPRIWGRSVGAIREYQPLTRAKASAAKVLGSTHKVDFIISTFEISFLHGTGVLLARLL
jgi:hypothetical protein